jgi:hypothetical protein
MAATPATESRLPAAQMARRLRLQEEAAARGENVEPGEATPPVTPPVEAPVTPPVEAPVTPPVQQPPVTPPVTPPRDPTAEMLRRIEAAEQRAQLLELQLAEARAVPPTPLTPPVEAPNADPTPAPTASGFGFAQAFDAASSATLTEQEQTDYGEATGAITKIATKAVLDVLRKPLEDMAARLGTLEGNVRETVSNVQRTASEGFIGTVKQTVTDFDTLVARPDWLTFLEGEVPYTGGMKFKQALANAHGSRNLKAIVDLFDKFRGGAVQPVNTSGYNAAPVASGASTPPPAQAAQETLAFSARKKASEDFLKGRITQQELDDISKKYNEAAAKGLIDYTK